MERFNLTRDQLYHYVKYHNIPSIKEKGFVEEPFKTSNFGWCGFGYIYDMCRLRQGKFLDFVSVRIT